MSEVFQGGGAGKTVYFKLRDVTTGLGKSGLTATDPKVVYIRTASTPSTVSLVSIATGAAWTSAGFVEISANSCPGLYRLDLPNASIASGVDKVVFSLTTTNVEEAVVIPLSNYDPLAAPNSSVSFADDFLDRDLSLGADSGTATVRTVRQALRGMRNKVDASGSVGTVYRENNTTSAYTFIKTGTPAVTVFWPNG